MEKITLTKVYRSDKDKQGKPFMTKDGRPYTRLAIQSQEYGSQWLSGFGNKMNFNWKEGDVVEVDIEKVEKDGKTYLNFSTPNIWDEIRAIKQRLDALEEQDGGRNDEGFEEANKELDSIPF